ncbi:MAG: YsnF/AvaK domain-containing protein [Bryobacteraceae bacterium]
MPTRTDMTVVAVFRDTSDAQAAAEELEASGFGEDQIFVNSADRTNTMIDEGSSHHEGGIAGWFKRMFGSDTENDRSYYENAVSSGNVLLSVETNEENLDTAADILNRHSPLDIHREGEGSASDMTSKAGTNATGAATADTSTAGQSKAIPVIEEELRVGKRAVLRGGVRVYSRVVEKPVEETVNLQEERVRVERQSVNRPVKESDFRMGADEVIEVQEYAEEPVISKEARVVEEVRINKEATQKNQTIKDTVRRTEVNVENLGEQSTKGTRTNIDDDFRSHFSSQYGPSGDTYENYAPAYRYGYDMASDRRYQGKDFRQVESSLRSDYEQRYPNSTWEKIKDSVRYGWDKVTGRSSSATTSR